MLCLAHSIYRSIVLVLVVVLSTRLFAAAYQIFPTLAYSNPAELHTITQSQIIFGATDILVGMKYSGLIDTQTGNAVSKTNMFYPYLSVAYRTSPMFVFSFNITHPVLSNIQFPNNSLVSPVAIDDILLDTNYSPNLSIQITKKFAVGAGFDANNMSTALLSSRAQSFTADQFINKSSGWQYGGHAGISYQINTANSVNASYYSQINFNQLKGYSQQGNVYSSNFSDNLVIPATWTLNLVHTPKERITIFEIARFIQWQAENVLYLNNSALGDLVIPLNYENSWSVLLGGRYQVGDKTGISAVVRANFIKARINYQFDLLRCRIYERNLYLLVVKHRKNPSQIG